MRLTCPTRARLPCHGSKVRRTLEEDLLIILLSWNRQSFRVIRDEPLQADSEIAEGRTEVTQLVQELEMRGPEFAAMWHRNEVQSFAGIVKRLNHPQAGPVSLEYSSLAIDGRADLSIVVWNPLTANDCAALSRIAGLQNEG